MASAFMLSYPCATSIRAQTLGWQEAILFSFPNTCRIQILLLTPSSPQIVARFLTGPPTLPMPPLVCAKPSNQNPIFKTEVMSLLIILQYGRFHSNVATAWPNLCCCKSPTLCSPHCLSNLIPYSSVTLQLQPQWSPCCSVKAPGMLLLRAWALVVPSAWNSPLPDTCVADILTHSRSCLKCHLLSVGLPIHPF